MPPICTQLTLKMERSTVKVCWLQKEQFGTSKTQGTEEKEGKRVEGIGVEGIKVEGINVDRFVVEGIIVEAIRVDGDELDVREVVGGKLDGEEVIGGKLDGEEVIGSKLDGEEVIGGKLDGEEVVSRKLVGSFEIIFNVLMEELQEVLQLQFPNCASYSIAKLFPNHAKFSNFSNCLYRSTQLYPVILAEKNLKKI